MKNIKRTPELLDLKIANIFKEYGYSFSIDYREFYTSGTCTIEIFNKLWSVSFTFDGTNEGFIKKILTIEQIPEEVKHRLNHLEEEVY